MKGLVEDVSYSSYIVSKWSRGVVHQLPMALEEVEEVNKELDQM